MMELKVVQKGRKINLSPHQVAFHAKHGALAVPTFILVHYFPPGSVSARNSEILLYRGNQAIEVHERGIDTVPLARWPLAGMPWRELLSAISES